MAIETIKVTLEGLEFPDSGEDDSKKNFRILATCVTRDASNDPGKLVAALPPLDTKNWQWERSGKSNFVPNDGKGVIKVDEIKPKSKKVILFDKTDILSINFKLLDIDDKNFLDFAAPILKKLTTLGLNTATAGISGIFLKIIEPVSKEADAEAAKLIDKLVNEGDKVLYEDEIEGPNNGSLKPGTYEMKGDGVLHRTGDNLGKYLLKVKVEFVPAG